jgi:hypothetical protein
VWLAAGPPGILSTSAIARRDGKKSIRVWIDMLKYLICNPGTGTGQAQACWVLRSHATRCSGPSAQVQGRNGGMTSPLHAQRLPFQYHRGCTQIDPLSPVHSPWLTSASPCLASNFTTTFLPYPCPLASLVPTAFVVRHCIHHPATIFTTTTTRPSLSNHGAYTAPYPTLA